MKRSELLDRWTRRLEGQTLDRDDRLEMDRARSLDRELDAGLTGDAQLHGELADLYRIEQTAADFVRKCSTAGQFPLNEKAVFAVTDQTSEELPRVEILPRKGISRKRNAQRKKSAWPLFAVAISALSVVFGGLWYLSRTSNPIAAHAEAIAQTSPQTTRQPSPIDPPRASSTNTLGNLPNAASTSENAPDGLVSLGKLRASEDCRWNRQPDLTMGGPRVLDLQAGVAELVLSDGPTIHFQGPALITVHSDEHIDVQLGQVRLDATQSTKPFSLTTPAVRLHDPQAVIALLEVNETTGTLVEVDQGRLHAQPWSSDTAGEFVLASEELNWAMFDPPWRALSKSPATAVALNDRGEFTGIVNVADQPLTIKSPQIFAQVLDLSQQELNEAPSEFPQRWGEMVERLNRESSCGEISLNGRTIQTNSPDELIEQLERLRQMMPPTANGNPIRQGSFSGALTINGRELRFDSREEFAAAQEQMLGPLFTKIFAGNRARHSPERRENENQSSDRRDANRDAGQVNSELRPGSGNAASAFSGTININGKSMQFTRPDEFDAARKKFFGK